MMIQEIPSRVRFASILMHLLFWVLSLVLFVVLIFLDINMLKLTGLEFLRSLKHPLLVISYHPMKNLLSQKQFPRIYKSFIISLSKIDLIEGNKVKLRDHYIPFGTNFNSEFEKLISTI